MNGLLTLDSGISVRSADPARRNDQNCTEFLVRLRHHLLRREERTQRQKSPYRPLSHLRSSSGRKVRTEHRPTPNRSPSRPSSDCRRRTLATHIRTYAVLHRSPKRKPPQFSRVLDGSRSRSIGQEFAAKLASGAGASTSPEGSAV
jgi:hypothetical protein